MSRLIKIPGFNLGVESEVIGKPNRELEYTIYAELKDMTALQKAPMVEEHEQWRLPLQKDGRVKTRLRLINGRRFTMTAKQTQEGVDGCLEITNDITDVMFQMLKAMAVDGYKKTRYSFPIAGTDKKWEIDVFLDKMGKPHNWVKIDLEVDKKPIDLPPFEIPVGRFIVEGHANPEEEKWVRKLWEEEWVKLDSPPVTTAI